MVGKEPKSAIPAGAKRFLRTAAEGSWQGVRTDNAPRASLLSREIFAQISEFRIVLSNQRQLFLAAPTLDLLFPADGTADLIVRLKINQPRHSVLLRETGNLLPFVLGDTAFEVIGNPGVEDAGWVGKYVDVVHHVRGLWHAASSSVIPTGAKRLLRSAVEGSWQGERKPCTPSTCTFLRPSWFGRVAAILRLRDLTRQTPARIKGQVTPLRMTIAATEVLMLSSRPKRSVLCAA